MSNSNIIFIDSTCVGSLALSGQVGTLTAILYQCLVTGGPAVSLDSITRSGNVATATKNNHGFQMITPDIGQWIVVSGAAEPEYNGYHRILSSSSNSFTFAVSGTPATPATGTLTAKFAPLGWSRPFSGTNKSVFQGDDLGDGLYHQFLDDGSLTIGARGCKARGYESMSDVDTGTAAVPTTAQAAASLIVKSDAASSAVRNWFIAGDGQGFYLGIRFHSSTSYWYETGYFGDVVSETAGDSYRGVIICGYSDASASYSWPHNANDFLDSEIRTATSPGKYKTRGYNQVPGSIPIGMMLHEGIHSYMGIGGMAYPNPANNGFHLAPAHLSDGARIIGRMPGLYDLWHSTDAIDHKTPLADAPALSGRKLMFVKGSRGSSTLGGFALDLTGPWR